MLAATFSIALLLSALAIAVLFGTVQASTDVSGIPKPSIPEFALKFVDSSYNVTTTDPYTGVDVTQQFDNNTIEIMIKNQPFTYSKNGLTYHLYYNVRTKPHFAENWTELYPVFDRPNSPYDWDSKSWSYSKYLFNPNSPPQSNSDFTVLSLPAEYPSNAQVDFQVEAIVGHDSQAWAIVHPFTPEYGGYYEPAIAYDTTSGWSNTQTITISEIQMPTPSPATTPTPTPYQEPQQTPQLETIIGAAIAAAVIVAGLGLLIYLIKRK